MGRYYLLTKQQRIAIDLDAKTVDLLEREARQQNRTRKAQIEYIVKRAVGVAE